ncbi:MAG: hypothetical protein UE295_04810 [Acutalibacteraceae bacterium]|nr:hypothetical protein [Acutalibacteraceae bacterium]
MVIYCYSKEQLHNPEIGNYTAFAISAYKYNATEKTRIAYYSDVFLEESDAKRFIHLCNSLKLDPVHLEQLIEESFISDINY